MNNTNILVVDDVEAIRTFVSLVLKRVGYEFVETADSAEVALEKVQQVSFDIILLDSDLPTMSGLTLLKRLQEHSAGSKVIMCSSKNTEEYIAQAEAAGALGFLDKPITQTCLMSLLTRLGFPAGTN